jgi:hypothetical protein
VTYWELWVKLLIKKKLAESVIILMYKINLNNSKMNIKEEELEMLDLRLKDVIVHTQENKN